MVEGKTYRIVLRRWSTKDKPETCSASQCEARRVLALVDCQRTMSASARSSRLSARPARYSSTSS